MPQFKVVKDGRRTTGDRGDWGVVYTPLGVFLTNEVEEIPEPDSTGSTTPDPDPTPDPGSGVGTADPDPEPEPKPKRRSPK